MNEEAVQPKAENAGRFPCPACGAGMTFTPEMQALSCAYCGHVVNIVRSNQMIVEHDLAEGERLSSSDWGSPVGIIHCENCGAQTVLEENTVAKPCSFCGSAQVAKRDELPGIRPESLIPFKVPEKLAKEAFARWIGRRFYAPSDIRKKHQLDRMTGVYIPFWTYDSETRSDYSAERGEYYWVTEQYTATENGKTVTKTHQVRKVRWYPVSGQYKAFFNDLLIHASTRLDQVMGWKVGHFDLRQLVGYQPEYLSGFVAEKYSIGLQEGWSRAREIIRKTLTDSITKEIGGDEVRNLNFDTLHGNVTYKHTLLPLWISAYHYRGKVYQFLVNGQSGEVHGQSPVSALKVAVTVIIILAVIAAIWLYGRYG